MKQLGNLAIVCAKRADVSLQISEGQVFVRYDTISPQPFSSSIFIMPLPDGFWYSRALQGRKCSSFPEDKQKRSEAVAARCSVTGSGK